MPEPRSVPATVSTDVVHYVNLDESVCIYWITDELAEGRATAPCGVTEGVFAPERIDLVTCPACLEALGR